MRRAFELARRGRCGASPNPMVGAVVLDADGRVVGEGHHQCCGGPHAEVHALAEAGELARGGSIYVSLEPCNHHGRTPPCTEAIITAGIRRVVISVPDPHPLAAGGGQHLRSEGIEVVEGVQSESGRILNRRWLRWVEHHRPWVSAKAAVSLDGRIATRTGHSTWITGEAARHRGLELREEHDAILVGVDTVLADNPNLTRRLGLNPGAAWRRIILDSKLRTPDDAVVVASDPQMTLIAHTAEAAAADRDRLNAAGVELVELVEDEQGRVSVAALLEHLGDNGTTALLVEGGASVHGSFFDADLVDEIFFFVAPMVIGGEAPPAVAGRGVADLSMARRFCFEDVSGHGDDLELHGVRPEDADVHGID
ncbi:MAG: bifunctional diaminohydroxyphosphoribosylaminopyrimidine deaminase/5-amino-6-(5-phosphoribosylamino)uracil reductase RibD [Thermoanaerobaculales bacterium]|jgi:diaminohydroxyphosphoribosylaminopyrimidine deaminase/5-amino-6-(5-phosphoribosylamino)uracil reductase|nr:bifunctional diaminohydroxyphosphoribosylaminopyrimidine deaminase/5-amino-6-(5-phosphoribosylamino)uracil reductase RibD [Thermoanaerobaculales bacterium]